jgi:outer membrane receptor protein involved in Fe transport
MFHISPWKRRHGACALLTALMTSAAAPALAAAADAEPSALSEVVVTATKRSENLQNVPLSVQALTPTVLSDHNVFSFDDYAKLLPSVSFQSFGPGQAQPYFRGITSGADGLHSGSEPGTGIYLDEIPVTTIANGIDIHMYDVARVEALSGPQGTLFGANSLSGTLRIITNQPDPKRFSAAVDMDGNGYTKGSFGGTLEGYVNEPITDRAAIRLVAFSEHDAGYIDNVYKTRDFTLTDGSTLSTNNGQYVKGNFNDTDTVGGRAALKVDLTDQWTVTPSVIYQNQQANGNFLYNGQLGDLKVADFSPDYNHDRWYQAALTVQGKVANWDVLYAGGYMDRHVDNAQDYSYYAVAYDAAGESSYVTFPDGKGGYLNPNQHFTGHDAYTKETHEVRATSPQDYLVRLIGGIFYERQTDHIIANYIVPGLAAAGDPRSVLDTDGRAGAGDDIYFTNIQRIDRDFALFGEAAYDILPNLTLTVGGRYFTADNTLAGTSGFVGASAFDRKTTEYGETHKANLSWKLTPNALVYATYSTGFRPGGANRGNVAPPYAPDTITNYEIGWKTTLMDGRLRLNGALFTEDWKNIQFSLAPVGFQGITFIYNVGFATSRGFEGDFTFRATDHLTISGSGTIIDAHLTKTFCDVNDECAYKGTQLPIQPRAKGAITVRYAWTGWGLDDFVQAAAQGQSETRSALLQPDEDILGPTGSFGSLDLSAGFGKDNWTMSAYIDNVMDTRGILSLNTDCSITYCGPYKLRYPDKPRQVGVKLGFKY